MTAGSLDSNLTARLRNENFTNNILRLSGVKHRKLHSVNLS